MQLTKHVFLLLSLCATLVIISCNIEPFEGEVNGQTNSDKPASCEEAILNTASAAQAFAEVSSSSENYQNLCNVYKTALENQIELCGDEGGIIQIIVNSLSCGEQLSDCDIAKSEVTQAKEAFDNADNENYVTLCNSYKSALQEQINLCGTNNDELSSIINSLGDCENDNSTGSNTCNNLQMFDIFGLPITSCNYSIYESLTIDKIYMDVETYFTDVDSDGVNDHYSKIFYITDGIISLDNENKIVSINEQTYLLELEINYKGTQNSQKIIPGLFEFIPSNGSYFGGGYFGDQGCNDGFLLCDKRNIIFNGVVSISIEEDGIYNFCFDSVIDLFDSRISSEDLPCYKSNYTGEIIPIKVGN
ncbi:hypothetical protein [Hyunsoonleella ulvae]|uniref:hypothetical protein n=1 Tax=Hyunsoonleella ulvae TaxID=2799948 RepID=UPI00193A206B|nr:hypothetical protein [Hyunsoonleella ulvae]